MRWWCAIYKWFLLFPVRIWEKQFSSLLSFYRWPRYAPPSIIYTVISFFLLSLMWQPSFRLSKINNIRDLITKYAEWWFIFRICHFFQISQFKSLYSCWQCITFSMEFPPFYCQIKFVATSFRFDLYFNRKILYFTPQNVKCTFGGKNPHSIFELSLRCSNGFIQIK